MRPWIGLTLGAGLVGCGLVHERASSIRDAAVDAPLPDTMVDTFPDSRPMAIGSPHLFAGPIGTYAVLPDGRVYAWGWLAHAAEYAPSPVLVPVFDGSVRFAVTYGSVGYACGLDAMGGVRCGGSGQPVHVVATSGIVDLALGVPDGGAPLSRPTLYMVREEGTVVAVDPDGGMRTVDVDDASGVRCGPTSCCVIGRVGGLTCWGWQPALDALGTDVVEVPLRIAHSSELVDVWLGAFACGLWRDGSVSCWGARRSSDASDCHFTFCPPDLGLDDGALTSTCAEHVFADESFPCAPFPGATLPGRHGTRFVADTNPDNRLLVEDAERRYVLGPRAAFLDRVSSGSPLGTDSLVALDAISLGDDFACWSLAGETYCSGANFAGQLGRGDRVESAAADVVHVSLP